MSARLRYGLRWRGVRVSLDDLADHLRTAMLLIGIVLAFGIAGSLDYAAEKAEEAERQAAQAERATRWLAECLNGKARFMAEDGRSATVCDRAWEVRL